MNIVITDFVGLGEQAPRVTNYEWLTEVVQYDNRREQRNLILAQPIRHWEINWEWLTPTARANLVELFNRARGRYYVFLHEDVNDFLCTYTDWSYALTTGDTTTQLQKTYYKGETEEWTEDKTRIQPSTVYEPTLCVDSGALEEGVDFTLDDNTGIVTWTGHTPTTGEILTADYKFYFPVRFDFDSYVDIEHQIDYFRNGENGLVEVIE